MSEPVLAGVQPGMVLAERFRVERFLAGGGMGAVYEAVDLELDEKVAIKTIRPEMAENERTRERFRREILFSRQVTHPSVCRVFEVFQHKGDSDVVFLTMELLEGETLKERLQREGALRPEQALPILQQVAEAVQAAHDKGIVHRDLKCSNIMLVPRQEAAPREAGDRVVVMDFGIARWHPTRDGASVVGGSTITAAGHLLGTPDTMAPEQLTGGQVTPATDVYAFGVVAYQAVTGHKPFEGVDLMDAVFKRLHEDPTPIRRHAPDLPESWVRTIGQCLQREPATRPAPIRDAVAGLTAPPRSRRRWVAAALLAALVLAALLFAVRPRRGADADATAAPPAAMSEARPALAILGFRDRQGRQETAWIGTVVTELLAAELTTDALRPVSGDNVARMLHDLGLEDVGSLTASERRKIHEQLGTSLLVHGAYHAGGGRLRFDVTVEKIPGDTTEVLLTEEAAEDDLVDLVTRTGEKLRGELGLGPGSKTAAKMPANLEATRLYAEGLRRLRLWDTPQARDLFQQSVQREPSALAFIALAEAWGRLGNSKESADAAAQAYGLREDLGSEDRLAVEARYYRSRSEWDEAIASYEALLERFPDDAEHGLAYASALRSATRFDDARAHLEGLLSRTEAPVERVRIDVSRVRTEYMAGDAQKARGVAADAAARAAALGARWLQAQALYLQAISARRLELFEETEAALDVAEAAFRELGDDRTLGRALQTRGSLMIDLQRYDDALACLEEAKQAYVRAGDDGGHATVYQAIGVVQQNLGEFQAARESLEKATRLSREAGHERAVVYCLNSLGLVAGTLGDLALARASFEESLEIARRRGNRHEISLPLANLANLLRDMGEYDAARDAYRESISIVRETSGDHAVALRLNGLAQLHADVGELDEAFRLFSEAREKIQQETPSHAGTLISLGEVHLERREFDDARRLFEESLAINESVDSPEVAKARQHLARLALAEGRRAEARALLEEALAAAVEHDAREREIVVRADLVEATDDAAVARRIYEEVAGVDDVSRGVVLRARSMEARVLALEGRREDARRIAEELVAECTEKGMVARALEYRLLLVEITGEGVEELEREARERGFLHIAQRARQVADER